MGQLGSGPETNQFFGLSRMLRVDFIRQWYSLSDEAVEDATTLLKFRRLPETNDLTQRMFVAINAPPSTRNAEHKRDDDMHQTKNGNQWYFGMNAHIGVDARKWSGAQPHNKGSQRC